MGPMLVAHNLASSLDFTMASNSNQRGEYLAMLSDAASNESVGEPATKVASAEDVFTSKNAGSSTHVEQKRARKREINRLSAERKRKRERIQLDAMHEMLQQLSQKVQAYHEDTSRLSSLQDQFVDILQDSIRKKAMRKLNQDQLAGSMASQDAPQQVSRVDLLEDIHTIERMIYLINTTLVDQSLAGHSTVTSSGTPLGPDSDENAARKTISDLLEGKKLLGEQRLALMRTAYGQQAARQSVASYQGPISSHAAEQRLTGIHPAGLFQAQLARQYGMPSPQQPLSVWGGSSSPSLPQVAVQMDDRGEQKDPFQGGSYSTLPTTASSLQRLLSSARAVNSSSGEAATSRDKNEEPGTKRQKPGGR